MRTTTAIQFNDAQGRHQTRLTYNNYYFNKTLGKCCSSWLFKMKIMNICHLKSLLCLSIFFLWILIFNQYLISPSLSYNLYI